MTSNSSLEKGYSILKPVYPDMPSPDMQRLFGRRSGRNHLIQRLRKPHVVEHTERDKALKMLWSSTASNPNSRRLDLCLSSGRS